jgi:putative ABC transport system permease protein
VISVSWLHIFVSRVRALFRNRPLERELNDELRSHIEMLVDANIRNGMTSADARHAAMRAFGGVEQVKEIYRDRRGLPFVDNLGQDVRYSFRMMRQNLGFTVVAVLSLALGIGANTAIFSLVDAVMLKYLPVERPRELLNVAIADIGSLTNPIWEQLRDHQNVFSGIFAWGHSRFNLSAGERRSMRRVCSPAAISSALWESAPFSAAF